jgi:maleate isomerase
MEHASGRPATTAATAFVDALTRLGVETIAIGAPWSKTMDKPMVDFMEMSGFKVVHSEVIGFVASIELGRVGPERAYELGRRADRPDADAVIMPGGNWPAMSVVDRLERELGKPVLANNAVSLWAGLRLIKTGGSIPGYGRLLRRLMRQMTGSTGPLEASQEPSSLTAPRCRRAPDHVVRFD